jgi:hypothetical protein
MPVGGVKAAFVISRPAKRIGGSMQAPFHGPARVGIANVFVIGCPQNLGNGLPLRAHLTAAAKRAFLFPHVDFHTLLIEAETVRGLGVDIVTTV